MATVEREGDRIALHTEYREKELVLTIPGTRWDRDRRIWTAPLSWAACVQLRETFGSDLRVGPELAAWARDERDGRIEPALALREAGDAEELAFMSALAPHQRAGVRFMMAARAALVADEMGTGKTVQTIAALQALEAFPALVISPKSVKAVWAQELAKWAPGLRVQVVDGGAVTRRKQLAEEADVYVMNYEQIREHSRLAPYGSHALSDKERTPKELNSMEFAAVVIDEAHRAKDPKTKWTRAIWSVAHAKGVRHRFALTGTPVANSPEDCWAIMHFVCPEEYPTKGKFIDRYCVREWNLFGFQEVTGIRGEAREELFRILDPRMIRRLKADVMPDLPEKTYQTRLVEMGVKQKRAYKQMEAEMVASLDDGTVVAANPLTKITRLVQFASAYGELSEQTYGVGQRVKKEGAIIVDQLAGGYATAEQAEQAILAIRQEDQGKYHVFAEDRQLLLAEPSCKADEMMELASELGGQQAVVFAVSRQLIDICALRLEDAGYRTGRVTGAVSADLRARAVQDFQDGHLQFILLTLGAGGEGLTLTAAQTAVFLQRSFSEVHNKQAEDRLHRRGQTGAVQILDLVTEGTIEARIHGLRATKSERLEEIVRDRERLMRLLITPGRGT